MMDFDSDASFSDDDDANLQLLNDVLTRENLTSCAGHSLESGASASSSQQTSTNTQQLLIPAINKTLSLNELLHEKAQQIETMLSNSLQECQKRLHDVRTDLKLNAQCKGTVPFRYVNCGRPYFKDRYKFPAPDNEDTVIIKKAGMFDFSLSISVPGWTLRDKTQFSSIVHSMTVEIRKKQIDSKIAEIKRKHKGRHSKKVEKEIADLKAEAENMSTKTLEQIVLPVDEDYDWEILANRLNRRHTPEECASLWKLFLHPHINKDTWSKEEHLALQMITSQHNYRDWDSIAKKLNTGRSGYQCFVYYRTNMCNSHTGKKWSPEETAYLKRLVDYYKQGHYIPWGKIAASMENRTKIQIYNKYLRLMEVRKGRFLPEEDAVILNYVEKFGPKFKRMIKYLPGRSKIQIRARYRVLSKQKVSTVWSVEDDKKLIQIMSKQGSMNFARATQHFPGKNRVKIRSRYVTLMKWMKKYPNLDLEHAPRRGARRLNHGSATENLQKALENLKHILNIEAEKKSKEKKIDIESSETDIEDAIVAFCVTELEKKNDLRKDPVENEQMDLGNYEVTSQNFTATSQNFNVTSPSFTAPTQNFTATSPNFIATYQNFTITSQNFTATSQNFTAISQNSNATSQNDTTTSQNDTTTSQNDTATSQNLDATSQNSNTTSQNDTATSQNDTATSQNLDVTNLRKCLIFLNSNLDQNAYQKSKYSKQYPNLGDTSKDMVTLKTYSRKRTTTTVECKAVPNVWGTTTLPMRNSVLPPHYATIVGCRALMLFVNAARYSSTFNDTVNPNVLARRNSILKEQIDLLLDRFYVLFTWPMILSRDGPSDFNNKKTKRTESAYIRPPSIPNAPEVAFNVRSMNVKKYKTAAVTEVIDLQNEDDNAKNDKVAAEKQDSEDDSTKRFLSLPIID